MISRTSSRIGKSVIERNLELFDTVPQSGNCCTGYLLGNIYALPGFDAVF